MMTSMSAAGDADRTSAARQPDLFDERGPVDADPVAAPPQPDAPSAAADLSDGALIALLPQASMSTVEALCSEVVTRGLAAAVPALEHLWRRFAGFGVSTPLVEQRAVLSTLAMLEEASAHAALRGIVLSNGLPESLLPAALQAAAQAGLSLPARFVGPLLEHEDAAVRAPAFALASKAGVPVELLRDGLCDRSPAVRRLAAIALGNARDADAMVPLVAELARNPSREAVEALAAVGDEDAIVHLGRCAGRHPELAGCVIDVLRDMESARAERLVRRLEAEGRASADGG